MRKEESVDYPYRFWSIRTTITCPKCNTTFPSDITHNRLVKKYVTDIEAEMNFFICPECRYEGIVLW